MLLKIKKHDEQIGEVDDVQTTITSTFVKKMFLAQELMQLKKDFIIKFNKLTSEKFEVRLKQANLASKNNIGKTNLDKFKTNF